MQAHTTTTKFVIDIRALKCETHFLSVMKWPFINYRHFPLPKSLLYLLLKDTIEKANPTLTELKDMRQTRT